MSFMSNNYAAYMNARFFAGPIPTQQEQLRKNMANYIIWNPKSKLPPTVVFSGRPEAIKVAGRMAGNNPGEEFYVCKLVHRATKAVPVPEPVVKFTDLENEVPF